MANNLPDDKTMCHRTGFEKRCKDMVVNCNCRQWVRLTGIDKDSDKPIDLYDCADAWGPQIQQQAAAKLSEQLLTIAQSVDQLRKEVVAGNDQTIVGTLGRLNDKMDAVASLEGPGSLATRKLLGS